MEKNEDNGFERLNLTPDKSPIALPDGKKQIPLGSGVITKLLGSGGMAAVYEIWNPELEMHRAVKLINPGSADIVHQRFQTEIKISAKLKHTNIVEIHGIGLWQGLPFIEMEKVEGIGLDEIISNRGALNAVVATSIGIMICRALEYAHTQDCTIYGKNYHGVIHRDLKPGNIMVGKNGIVKLMDFGIARPVDVTFQTMDGLVSGTLPYLAPEQIEKKKLDVQTDIYALGATLYEIVTGTVAFPQNNFAQLVACKTRGRFKPIEEFSVRLPLRLRRVIYKCMQRDIQKRFDSAETLLDELEKIHNSLTKKTPEEIMTLTVADAGSTKLVLAQRKRLPWKLVACTGLVLIAAAITNRYKAPLLSKINSIRKANAPQTFKATSSGSSINQSPPQVPADSASKAMPSRLPFAAKQKRESNDKTIPNRPPNQPNKKKLIETLSDKYETSDPIAIMTKELGLKNYANVIAIFNSLSLDQAKSNHALLCKMHALEGIGDLSILTSFFQDNTINDGEYFLGKAKFAYRRNDLSACLKSLDQAMKSPHVFIDYDLLKREVYYYMALCATAQFDASPNEQTYKSALDSWWQVRTSLRTDPGNEYMLRANQELQRMGKKMQKG